ncbi:hypothetical protein CLOSTASPAR_06572 [[Clostridium] asparagiforme DSM 15981]|uniref:Uncharacterized protein n=1 Tax=[Clostridium] asparagiforme DSM 15981 TaxID=518636 RepID=C0DBB7_9FIRM|nr:hypothetical protein CLOSTASPAR_06572 [[Clostridium] asparagiforme DSM 15981]
MDTMGFRRRQQANAGANIPRSYFTTNRRGLKQSGERFRKIGGFKREI